MSTLAPRIEARLSGYAPLTAQVGDRIYLPYLLQETDLPAVYFQLQTTEPQNTLTGEVDLFHDNWEIVSVGQTYQEASTVADLVLDAMTQAGSDFASVRTGSGANFLESSGLHAITATYSIWAKS